MLHVIRRRAPTTSRTTRRPKTLAAEDHQDLFQYLLALPLEDENLIFAEACIQKADKTPRINPLLTGIRRFVAARSTDVAYVVCV